MATEMFRIIVQNSVRFTMKKERYLIAVETVFAKSFFFFFFLGEKKAKKKSIAPREI